MRNSSNIWAARAAKWKFDQRRRTDAGGRSAFAFRSAARTARNEFVIAHVAVPISTALLWLLHAGFEQRSSSASWL